MRKTRQDVAGYLKEIMVPETNEAYADNPAMLVGLKVMAIAEIEHGTLVNQDIFWHGLTKNCHALKKEILSQ